LLIGSQGGRARCGHAREKGAGRTLLIIRMEAARIAKESEGRKERNLRPKTHFGEKKKKKKKIREAE